MRSLDKQKETSLRRWGSQLIAGIFVVIAPFFQGHLGGGFDEKKVISPKFGKQKYIQTNFHQDIFSIQPTNKLVIPFNELVLYVQTIFPPFPNRWFQPLHIVILCISINEMVQPPTNTHPILVLYFQTI